MSEERITGDIVVGVKQTFRMIEQRKVSVVYIAEDADSFVTKGVEQAALKNGTEVIRVASKRQLGKALRHRNRRRCCRRADPLSTAEGIVSSTAGDPLSL